MKLLNWIKQLLHIHDWVITQQGDYDIIGMFHNNPTIRQCKTCKQKQFLIVECLGLNPPIYKKIWRIDLK